MQQIPEEVKGGGGSNASASLEAKKLNACSSNYLNSSKLNNGSRFVHYQCLNSLVKKREKRASLMTRKAHTDDKSSAHPGLFDK